MAPHLSRTPAGAPRDARLTTPALRVLGLLSCHTDGDGRGIRRKDRVAAELGYCTRHLNRALALLVKLGYLERHRIGRYGGLMRFRVLAPAVTPPAVASPNVASPGDRDNARRDPSSPLDGTQRVRSTGLHESARRDSMSPVLLVNEDLNGSSHAREAPAAAPDGPKAAAALPDSVLEEGPDKRRGARNARPGPDKRRGARNARPGPEDPRRALTEAALALHRRIAARLGLENGYRNDLGEVMGWLEAGYDADRHVMAAIERAAKRRNFQPPLMLAYFREIIAEEAEFRAARGLGGGMGGGMRSRPPPAPAMPPAPEPEGPPEWLRLRDALRFSVRPDAFAAWLQRLEWQGIDGSTLVLTAPTRFIATHVAQHWGALIERAAVSLVPGTARVEIVPAAPGAPSVPDCAGAPSGLPGGREVGGQARGEEAGTADRDEKKPATGVGQEPGRRA